MSVDYVITITQPQRHLVEVTLHIDAVTTPTLQIQMPTWTPGSYLIREYARHVRDVRAFHNSTPLECRKTDKLTWKITTNGAKQLRVQYLVYGHELTVRTNHIDATHAHLTPAATFMFVPGREQESVTVEVHAPQTWQITTGLTPLAAAKHPTYQATNLDQLLDTPFEIGIQRRLEWEVDGKQHALVIWGAGNEDSQQLVADARKIVENQRDFWGELPYEQYTFILLLGGPKAGGGLEHHNSTVLLLPRHIFKPATNYERYLGLVSHEFFHTWNVKRLRAEPLGPFDYTRENYTRLLWVMEGFTEYYTDLLLARADLLTPERYLERLAKDIITLQTTPGRLQQSVSEASFDAWIRLYRPDETTPNTTISYYLKGGLVAFCLDMAIRERTEGRKSLDDVIRYLYATYPISGPGIPERDGMLRALEQVAPGEWQSFFDQYVDGVAELPFEEALAVVGLKPQWSYQKTQDDQPVPQLGVRTAFEHGRVKLTHVLDGGTADKAGLAPGDELVALNSWRIDHDLLPERLADYAIGATVQLTFFRNDVLHTLGVTFERPPYDQLKLVLMDDVDAQQKAHYDSWLKAAPTSGASATKAANASGTEEFAPKQ